MTQSVIIQHEDYSHLPAGTDPVIDTRPAIALPVVTETAPGAARGMAIVTRIHPRGLACTWAVQYGPTVAYGTTTAARSLPPKLAAHYVEDWDWSVAGYRGGVNGIALSHQANAGYIRYQAEDLFADDDNHIDGIGMIRLPLYFYPGAVDPGGGLPMPKLGGGVPDLRGARMRMRMRGWNWLPRGSDLSTWVQVNLNDGGIGERRANWANTGNRIGWAAACNNEWQDADWYLRNTPHAWTYAGRKNTEGVQTYFYKELDATLRDVDVDVFPLQNVYIQTADATVRPTGRLEFDRLHITYRQHSLCYAGNGGTLTSSPAGGSGAEFLTDGYRNGPGREWISVANPTNPQDFVFTFATPVVVQRVMIHNATTNPSRAVVVAVSNNLAGPWTDVAAGDLPQTSVHGPNFLYLLASTFNASAWSHMRVRVTSGWQAGEWRLGEIEAFGTGAVQTTDADWYDVNQDIAVAAGTWNFRVAVTSSLGTVYGPNQTIVVP